MKKKGVVPSKKIPKTAPQAKPVTDGFRNRDEVEIHVCGSYYKGSCPCWTCTERYCPACE